MSKAVRPPHFRYHWFRASAEQLLRRLGTAQAVDVAASGVRWLAGEAVGWTTQMAREWLWAGGANAAHAAKHL